MIEKLCRYGFVRIGRWVKSNHKSVKHLRLVCATGVNYEVPLEWQAKRDVAYAFVIDDIVRYIGETSAGMVSRFNGYRYGNPLVSDVDNRVKIAITNALLKGLEVEIWAHRPIATLALPDGVALQVPASKPLEEYLIGMLRPELNVKNLRDVPPADQA